MDERAVHYPFGGAPVNDAAPMSSRTVNEVRLLFWPWYLMTLAGLVPLVRLYLTDQTSGWPEAVAVFGFFGGAAFLTALSFHRLPALLSNVGADRHKIWSGKMAVLSVAVLCSGLIACLVQTALGAIVWREASANALEPVLLLAIIVCSTGFWTLLARSIVGGLLLTAAAQFVLYLLLVLFVTAIDRMAPASPGTTELSHVPEVHSALSWFVAGFGLSYAALMLWLGRRRFVTMELRDDAADQNRLKSFIRNFSAVTEFFLVIFICFGATIVITLVWLMRHFSDGLHMPASGVVHLRNDGVITTVIIELFTLGIVLWMGRIRGWSLATFGFRPSWTETGAGVLLFAAFLLVQHVIGWLTRGVFHSAVDFHRASHLAIPFIILISAVNPLFEEAIESGYFFHALQRHGPVGYHFGCGCVSRIFACNHGCQRACRHVCDGLALWICLLEMASAMAARRRAFFANVVFTDASSARPR